MRARCLLLGLLLAGCAEAPLPSPPSATPQQTDRADLVARQAGEAILAALPRENPYEGLLAYYGDTHFHSGYSGDNSHDGPPLKAWQSALARTRETARRGVGPWLGGYFLFVTDHVSYINTRQDMNEALFQKMRQQADDPSVDRKGPEYTFTAFPGAEMTGLRRGRDYPHFDDKFGHLNFFLMDSIAPYVETDLADNLEGERVMDSFAADPTHLAQFNHPGYGEEPRTGDDDRHLYPYTPERDRVFRWIEVNDDRPAHWDKGVSQYNLCLRRGYHISPVVGTDVHRTEGGLTGQARTVLLAPSTLGMPVAERREVLMGAARAGRVYATENQTLLLEWSLDGYPMGARLEKRTEGEVKVLVRCATSEIERVELAADMKPEVAEDKIENESQCTRTLAQWRPKGSEFSTQQKVRLTGVHYLYLRVWLGMGERAVTSPIYLESSTARKP